MLPTMTGQRFGGAEQVGEVGVLSAAGFGGGGFGGDAGFVDRGRPCWRASRHVVEIPGQADRHTKWGSGIGPSTSTCAPVSRSCCTRRVRPSIHAGPYDVVAREGFVGAVASPQAQHDQPWVLGAQPGDDLTRATPRSVGCTQPGGVKGLVIGKSSKGQAPLASISSRQCRWVGDLLERRSPHRGMRVADQGHRRRRSGIAHRALRLPALERRRAGSR